MKLKKGDLVVIKAITEYYNLDGLLCTIAEVDSSWPYPFRVIPIRMGYIISRSFKEEELSSDKELIFNKLWDAIRVDDELCEIFPNGEKLGFQKVWSKTDDILELSYTHQKNKELCLGGGLLTTKDTFKKNLFSRGGGFIYKRKNKLHKEFEIALNTKIVIPINFFKRKEVRNMTSLLKRLLSPDLRLLSKHVLVDGNLDMENPLVQQALLATDSFRAKLIELCKEEEKKGEAE